MLDQNLFHLNEKFNVFMNIEQEDKERFQNIVSWTGQMMELSVKEKLCKGIFPKRGEIWTCHFGENVGSEVNKTRPCVILQNDIGNSKGTTTIVAPIMSRKHRLPTHVALEESDLVYVETSISGTVVAEQIRLISKARLGRKCGEFSPEAMIRIENAVALSLDMNTAMKRVIEEIEVAITSALSSTNLSDDVKKDISESIWRSVNHPLLMTA